MSRLALRTPVKVYNPADNVNHSGGIVAKTYVCQNPDGGTNFTPIMSRFSFQAIHANYTAVTVKAQATLDNSTWFDLPGKTTSTSGNIVEVDTIGIGGPYHSIRIHVTATDSGGDDTMEVWVGVEYLD